MQVRSMDSIGTWNVVVQLDGTSMDMEPFVVREAVDLGRHLPADARGVIQLRRSGRSPASQRWLGRLELAAAPLGIAAAAGAAQGLGLNPLGAAAAASAIALWAWRDGRKRLQANRFDLHREPAWSGTRTYVTRGPSKGLGVPAESRPSAAAPDAQELAGRLAWPARYRVLVVSGHRKANRVGGIDLSELNTALESARKQTGRKTDLLVLEGCRTADLGLLEPLAGGARYALVSQDTLWAPGLPWPHVLDRHPADPEALARQLVEAAGGLPGVPTLSLIDLERLPELQRCLKALPPQAGRALAEARGFGAGLHDLGDFLARLGPDPAVRRCRELLSQAVIAQKVTEELAGLASGLSVGG
ncbi:MAG: hypothetical protein HY319_19875 [Armatimonadetes bacterium]|nr:hypothetical protein [Armatimonadota bacterium]